MVSGYYVRLVGSLLLSMLILYVAFGDQGIVSNTSIYLSQLEPIVMQNFLVTSLNVGAFSPGEFSSSFETSGKAHKIMVSTENNIRFLKVEPSQGISYKTKFKDHIPIELSVGDCILIDKTIQLKTKPEMVSVRKFISSTGQCVLSVESSG